MEEMFLAFLSWQFLFFCIAIGSLVFMLRRLIEHAMENWWPLKQWSAAHKESTVWTKLVLPIMPIILGQVISLSVSMYPYPEGFSSLGGRWIFGLVAGFSSSFVVRAYNALLSSKVTELTEKVTTLIKPKDDPELVKETTTSVKSTITNDSKLVEKVTTVVQTNPENDAELTEKKTVTTSTTTETPNK